MSKFIKCDKCENLVSSCDNYHFEMTNDKCFVTELNEFDLCPDCYNQFLNFLKGSEFNYDKLLS